MRKLLISGVFFALAWGCNSGGSRDDDDDTAVREGETLAVENLKNFDARPSLSADGLEIVFLSGRDDVLRAYKYSVGEGTRERVTDDADNVTQELEAVISPDGKWVLLAGIDAEKTGRVFLKPYDGSSAAVALTDDEASSFSDLSWTADSAGIVFRRLNEDNSTILFGVIDDDGLNGDLLELNSSEETESSPVLVPSTTASQYQVATIRRDSASFSQSLILRVVAVSGGSASTSSTETLASDIFVLDDELSRSPSGVLYHSTNPDGDDQVDPVQLPGDAATGEDLVNVLTVTNQVIAASATASILDLPGIRTLMTRSSLVTTDGVGFVLRTEGFKCVENEAISYGTSLFSYDWDNQTAERVQLVTTEDSYAIVESVCEAGENAAFDRRLTGVAVSADSTTEAFQMSFVSFTSDDEKNSGNSEVWLMTFDGSEYQFTKVSND